jgi:hypothetical protein
MPSLWYQTSVRVLRFIVALVTSALVACSVEQPSAPRGGTAVDDAVSAEVINPDNLPRMRHNFPAGYEVENLTGPFSPAGLWGLTAGWVADPPRCAALAAPAAEAAPTRGLSGSGPGGIIYTVVATTDAPAPALEMLNACARWTITSPNSTATVDLVDAPRMDRVATVATASATRTVVEGGRETDSAARTATAYPGEHIVFVTVVTDPGSPQPQLPQDFAAEFLAQTLAALRG